ncbi:lactate utilization protein C [Bacillus tianshenii]|nr:lactate utilization protein C [Bacillus tianshenii]
MRGQGEVRNRDSFLKHLSKQLGRTELKQEVKRPNWGLKPQYKILQEATQEELVELLKAEAAKVNTPLLETTTDNLSDTLEAAIGSFDNLSIVTWDDPRFEEYETTGVLNKHHWHTWNASLGEENVRITQNADIGITFCDYALAESGTVVLTSSAEQGRSVSLLPTAYIAIIPKSKIVPRLTQVTDAIHEKFQQTGEVPSCMKFISGPSNSGDIEMNLVVGVHGPIKATYIVINDQ